MSNTIEKTLKFRGKEESVWFREMTVGDTQKLIRNTKATVGEDGKARQEVDFGSEYERGLLQLSLTLVDGPESNKKVYSGVVALQNESSARVGELLKLCKEAEKEFADSVGNG